jgi:aspartyl-tRNA synthetase
MILMNEPNIREVMAFPKTGEAEDLMMGAPSELSKERLSEVRITVTKK